MGWNGSGSFTRLYSWVADKAAGLDISSTRMDADTNDITTAGLGNCLTRDGQGQPSANLPMNSFRHTTVGVGVARTDYAAMSQAQDGLIGWTIASGTADAITATYTPTRGAPSDGSLYGFRATAANATTTPTFAPDSQTARTITKAGGVALSAGDIPGNLAECWLRYNSSNTRYELLNPASAGLSTGDVKLTVKTTADPGWLLFDDGTFGSATSGSSNSNSASNQALFTVLFNNTSDSNCPILTSGGAGTTRAGQGTAAAAWANNCRMTLPKTLGRALATAGTGSGLTARALAATTGVESIALGAGNLPAYTPAGTLSGGTLSVSGGTFGYANAGGSLTAGGGSGGPSGDVSLHAIAAAIAVEPTFTGTGNGGLSTPFSVLQPSSFFNVMIKQ